MPAISKLDGRKLLAIGLFWGSATFVLNDSVLIGDVARGLWAGVGLGIEVLGLWVLVKQRRGRNECPSRPLAG